MPDRQTNKQTGVVISAVISFCEKDILQYRIAHFRVGLINFASSSFNNIKCVAVLYVYKNERRYFP